MRRSIRYPFLLLSICLLMFSAAVEGRGQNVLREVLKRLDAHNKALQSLQASVTMVKFNSQLNIADTSYGSTSYVPRSGKRVRHVRIDWTKPVEEQMSSSAIATSSTARGSIRSSSVRCSKHKAARASVMLWHS